MKRRKHHKLAWLTRGIWLLTGLALFFWVGYGDRRLLSVLICSALLCLASGLTLAMRFEARRYASKQMGLPIHFVLYGSAIGAAVGPVAVLLILTKTGLHSHPKPDFESADMIRVLMLSPAWALAGSLVGLAGGLVRTDHGVER